MLFTAISLFGLLCGIFARFGGAALIAIAAVCWVIVVWAVLYIVAPKATPYLAVLAFVAFCLFAIVPTAVLQSRTEARDAEMMRKIRVLGVKIQRRIDRGEESPWDPSLEPVEADEW